MPYIPARGLLPSRFTCSFCPPKLTSEPTRQETGGDRIVDQLCVVTSRNPAGYALPLAMMANIMPNQSRHRSVSAKCPKKGCELVPRLV